MESPFLATAKLEEARGLAVKNGQLLESRVPRRPPKESRRSARGARFKRDWTGGLRKEKTRGTSQSVVASSSSSSSPDQFFFSNMLRSLIPKSGTGGTKSEVQVKRSRPPTAEVPTSQTRKSCCGDEDQLLDTQRSGRQQQQPPPSSDAVRRVQFPIIPSALETTAASANAALVGSGLWWYPLTIPWPLSAMDVQHHRCWMTATAAPRHLWDDPAWPVVDVTSLTEEPLCKKPYRDVGRCGPPQERTPDEIDNSPGPRLVHSPVLQSVLQSIGPAPPRLSFGLRRRHRCAETFHLLSPSAVQSRVLADIRPHEWSAFSPPRQRTSSSGCTSRIEIGFGHEPAGKCGGLQPTVHYVSSHLEGIFKQIGRVRVTARCRESDSCCKAIETDCCGDGQEDVEELEVDAVKCGYPLGNLLTNGTVQQQQQYQKKQQQDCSNATDNTAPQSSDCKQFSALIGLEIVVDYVQRTDQSKLTATVTL